MSQSPTAAARPQASRERSRSVLSYSSNTSDKSKGSAKSKNRPVVDLKGYHEKKRSFGETTKSNPSMAICEDQPFVVANEKSTLAPLRDFRYKDINGNFITDADLSNPTRHRMERPLDTIRSFEAAIDESYKRRAAPLPRSESDNAISSYSSRRSSMIGPESSYNRNQQGYRGGPSSYRNSHQQYDQHYYGSMRPPNPRYASAPPGRMNNDYNSYSNQQYQEYYDAQGYSSGSHSTEPWGNSTDPSSENSSVERMQPPERFDQHAQYSQYGQPSPIQKPKPFVIEEEGYNNYPAQEYDEREYNYPANPPQEYPPARAPAAPKPLPKVPAPVATFSNGPSGNQHPRPPPNKLQAQPREAPQKRKSWLKRRFSKG